MLHTPSLKEIPEQIHPLCLHPFLSCWYLASHVYCHYIPLSWLTERWGTVTDLSSVQNKRTTGNFAFEGLIMHERLKWVRAKGGAVMWPSFQPQHAGTNAPSALRVTDGSVLATACGELPILSSIALCTEDSWEADIPSSQLSVENKRVWDPSYTHVHVRPPPPPPPPQKKLSIQLQADYISARLVSRQQSYEPETFVEGEYQRESERRSQTRVGILKCWHPAAEYKHHISNNS